MKNYISAFTGFCICVPLCVLAGCSRTEETKQADFSLSRYGVAFTAAGGSANVEVGTDDNWTASVPAEWVSLDRDGSTLFITAAPNTESPEIRETEVAVATNMFGTLTISVRQEPAAEVSLHVNGGSDIRTIDSEGGTLTLTVECDHTWTAALSDDITGWRLDADTDAGAVVLTAEANTGDTVTGTILVTAASGALAVSEEIPVVQISRSENPYFQFAGDWNIHSADCSYGGSWYGEGTYASCSIATEDYAAATMTLLDWAREGLRIDGLEYNAENRSLTVPLGFCGGTMQASTGTATIDVDLYFVALNTTLNSYSTDFCPVLTLSEDGSSISVSGLSDEFPVLGWLGYSKYYSTPIRVSNAPYCKAPLTLTRTSGTSGETIKSGSV